ncbi:MAG TPA: glycosyltransferase family 9 protein [Thermoanaerobaculia bacterium]|jgi:heptosyltransferase-2|nr:glycosyltransferase family 9 protein [Thermoanaerobaculia bacterium]
MAMSPRRMARMTRAVGAGLLEAAVATLARRRPRAALPEAPGAIFVLRNNDVGDVLAATPLFDALRRRFPSARIAAGVGPWAADVLRGNPHVSEVLPVAAPWFNKYAAAAGPLGRLAYVRRSPEVAEIARRRFDVGIDVVGTAWGSLLLLQAGIPCRLGVRGYDGGHSAAQACVSYDPGESVARAALRFAELLGAADLPEARPQVFLSEEERRAGEGLWAGAGKRRVVVAPGGGLAVKLWPRERFAEVIRRLGDRGGVETAVVGGPLERGLAEELAAGVPGARALPGLTLRETFALVAACDLVICNSSMLLHAAAAFRRPTVAVLGPSFPSARRHQAQWGYPGCVSLGREAGAREELATPEEALAAARKVAGW